MTKVSIIIPVYNAEKYLEKCLLSILQQTYKDYSIIIINDGSTDNVEKIADKYIEENPDIIEYYSKENGGLSSARNYGIVKAKSEYVVFLDSDDYLEEHFLERLVDVAEQQKSDVVCSGQLRVNEEGEVLSRVSYHVDIDGFCVLRHLNMHGKLYRLDYIKSKPIRFPEGKLYEDNSFNIVMFFVTNNIQFVEYEGYNQVIHIDSITARKINKKDVPFAEFQESLNYLMKNINKINDYSILEYTVMSFLSYFIFEANKKHRFYKIKGRKSELSLVYELCDYAKMILNTYFRDYLKNPYLKIRNKKDITRKQFLGVWLFTKLIKYNLIKPFVYLYYKV